MLPKYELFALFHFASTSSRQGVIPLSSISSEWVQAYMVLCKQGYIDAADSRHPVLTAKARDEILTARHAQEQYFEDEAKELAREDSRRKHESAQLAFARNEQFRHDRKLVFVSVGLALAADLVLEAVKLLLGLS